MIRYRVTIAPYAVYPATGTQFVLGDDSIAVVVGNSFANGAGGSCQDGFLGDGDDLLQYQPGYRAPYQSVYMRGNLKETINLKVTRVHDTETNAVLFLATHTNQVPRTGLLKVAATCGNGVQNLWMPNARVGKITRPKQTGLRMDWTYLLAGNGPWLTAAPAGGT